MHFTGALINFAKLQMLKLLTIYFSYYSAYNILKVCDRKVNKLIVLKDILKQYSYSENQTNYMTLIPRTWFVIGSMAGIIFSYLLHTQQRDWRITKFLKSILSKIIDLLIFIILWKKNCTTIFLESLKRAKPLFLLL